MAIAEPTPDQQPEADELLDRVTLNRLVDDIADVANDLALRKHLTVTDAIHVVGVGLSLLLIPQPASEPPVFILERAPEPEDVPDNVIPFPTQPFQPQEA